MDRWKSRGGKSQRREEKRRDETRREEKRGEIRRERARRKSQKKEDAGARKAEKSRNTVFFPMICGSGGSKSRLAKVAGAEPAAQMGDEKLHAVVARSTFSSQNVQSTPGSEHFLEVEMSKKCAPLWREANFQVNMCEAHHARTTFGSWHVEKVHAIVARKAFRSQHVQSSSAPEHFWKLRCWKSVQRCGAKHISKSTCTKRVSPGTLLEVAMLKKYTALWREAHFEVKMYKAPHVGATFGRWSVVLCGRRKGFSTLPKVSKTWRFCSMSKHDGRRGAFKEDLQRWISGQETCSSEMLGG